MLFAPRDKSSQGVDDKEYKMEMQGTAENWTAYNEVCLWLEDNAKRENKYNIRTKLRLFVHGDLDVLLAMLRANGPYYSNRYLLGADRTSKICKQLPSRDIEEFTY